MKHLSYVGAAATAIAYAVALTTRRGIQFRRDDTWLSVVVGVGLTLAWLATADKRAATRALQMFAVTGTPVIVVCVMERLERDAELFERLRG